jgi:3-hydroxymyristoyl/3-hydroxydecanoyl-(acyl carrier protein) dehydratase
VRDVKIRTFTAPGQRLDLAADLQSSSADTVRFKLAARAAGRLVASALIDVTRSN